ncbi:DUF2326 domain-containing protein [Pelistega suis]|uniref:DUF2326 domain-containing protein n=1 Tax=Pelistega suis TaxID=1631957 RepID=A0A849P2A1_9BURK|nr:DUF2326 domain-containing protein [Pelistega suis]NOL51809.1 DUF2326 domain-containing protein [Pelistega suis]
MKLSKLYSNQDSKFTPIIFNGGLNFIYGDVRLPKDVLRDSHNLGKTTLAALLDFMFLAKRDNRHFLFANIDIFKGFVFFLEIKLGENKYLTIKRSVAEASSPSFIAHTQPHQNYKDLADEQWTHSRLSFDRAKTYLDGELNLTAVKHWKYRKIINYLIRTQDDFSDVFKLHKYSGQDSQWKPYMADLLGFDGKLARQRYEYAQQVNEIKAQIKERNAFDEKSASEALSKVDGRLLLRKNELVDIQKFVDNFNFHEIDRQSVEQLVSDIDNKIAVLNMKEYSLKNNIRYIEQSFSEDKIKFNPTEVQALFDEANVLLPDQITKDFEQLIAFNKAITKERKAYLKQELKESKAELEQVIVQLKHLNEQREDHLSFLKESELVNKFRESNRQIAEVQTDIFSLEQQKENIESILDLQEQQRALKLGLDDTENKMQTNVKHVNEDDVNTFAKIRLYFNEIISTVLNKRGELFVFINNEGNLEFRAEYQDKHGKNTNESRGSSYRKFLCIAFDLAVARSYIGQNYPCFIYIDGVFDGLDNRKKDLLLSILRKYSDIGIQIIATTINSEVQGLSSPLTQSEITLTLHDNGIDGRLFKMPTW